MFDRVPPAGNPASAGVTAPSAARATCRGRDGAADLVAAHGIMGEDMIVVLSGAKRRIDDVPLHRWIGHRLRPMETLTGHLGGR